ncbi:hypothetical protein ATCC90586_009877 [Pythium insidiosum]|nr:hypothetical protein ATCC90586_009877 [Pythium insidiosum]
MAKTLSLAALIAAALIASSVNAQSCMDQRDGVACQTSGGAPSRCRDERCRQPPKPCAPGSAELQSCGRDSYCAPFTSPELMCLEKDEIPRFMSYDSCKTKPDDTPCSAFKFEGTNGGSAALYEGQGKCYDGYCLPPYTTACMGKKDGDACTYKSVLGGEMREFSGNCKVERNMLGVCEQKSNTILGRATPVKAFDNRPDAPRLTNTSALDTCDVLVPGLPCTEKSGKPSRCGDSTCLPMPEPCPADAKEFQKCGPRGDGICAEFNGNKALSCVNAKVLVAAIEYDTCEGKKDGDDCQGVVLETPNGRPTLFESVDAKCKGHRCMVSGIVACQNKRAGASCSFKDVKDGEWHQ